MVTSHPSGGGSDHSYDVKVWAIRENQRKRHRTYAVRWVVSGREWPRTFRTRALAESFRSDLISAMRRGEPFYIASGLPNSMGTAEQSSYTWFELACAYVDMKWPRVAAKSRASIADALATITPALTVTSADAPKPALLREALYGFAFNVPARTKGDPLPDLVNVLRWIERNTIDVSRLSDPVVLRRALDEVSKKQDGTQAAATTFLRKRAVLHNVLEHAVELGHLESNPLSRVKWNAPKATDAVDPRVLVDRKRAEALLVAVGEEGDLGERLVAFFGCMYYAGMRPGEVVQLCEPDLIFPDEEGEWGEFRLHESAPSVARRWTDSGQRRERRQLKHRALNAVRVFPCHPTLVRLLRKHLDDFGTSPDGRLFRAKYRNGQLSESVYGRIWQQAREKALTGVEAASPLVRRPYDLRHACLTTWLNAGVEPALVAEWAGNSVNVLLRVYVNCIIGRDKIAKKRIERALAADDE